MSAFLLVRGGPPEQRRQRALPGLRRFEEIGFRLAETIEGAFGTLFLFAGLARDEIDLIRFDNGDFVYAAGVFLHQGRRGKAALERFHAGLAPDWRPGHPAGSFGHFALLVHRQGRLTVVTDSPGLTPVFLTEGGDVVSSSFLAASAMIPRPSLSLQNVCEYVFNGSVLGDGTLFSEINRLPMNGWLEADADGIRCHRTLPPTIRAPLDVGQDRLAATALDLLREEFSAFTAGYGDSISCALSGGYDSRLILALLREQGVRPDVFVYGRSGDSDVEIARTIAAGEGFTLHHIDKSAPLTSDPGQLAAEVHTNFLLTDGYLWGGLFGSSKEPAERQRRSRDGRLFLNGGGGEIFRNFFYLGDGRFTPLQVMWTFYAQFDPSWCDAPFDERRHHAALVAKVDDLLGRTAASTPRLERHMIEWLYPAFRCRSWLHREIQSSNWAGTQVNPFLSPTLIDFAPSIPLKLKNFGLFEAELIRRVDRRLAAYPSAYGHDFCTPPSRRFRVRAQLDMLRPPALRRLSFRLRHRFGHGTGGALIPPAAIRAVLGEQPLGLARLFRLDRVTDPAQFNRILSAEYVARIAGNGADFAPLAAEE